MKENEDCPKKFVEEITKASKEELTEDVRELKMIIRTTDKLVEAIKEQGKQIEEFQENLKEVNKVSIQKLDENKLEAKHWSACLQTK